MNKMIVLKIIYIYMIVNSATERALYKLRVWSKESRGFK